MKKISNTIFNKISRFFSVFYIRLQKDIGIELQKRALKTTADYVEANMANVESVGDKFSLLKKALGEATMNGSYLEFGVYRGETINYIASIKKDATIYGFDSFEGLPEFWRDGFGKGVFRLNKLPKVKENVVLIKGWFNESLREFLEGNKQDCAFVHIDSDLYSSAKSIFDLLRGRIKLGTIIVFDEFFNYPGWKDGECKAFSEFIEENKLKFEYITYNKNHEQVAVRII